jgi:hypothetical protein
VAEAGGWAAFCAGLHTDPCGVLRYLPGWARLERLVEWARKVAFSLEEAVARQPDDPVPTAADAAQQWQECLEAELRRWHTEERG